MVCMDVGVNHVSKLGAVLGGDGFVDLRRK